MNRQEFIKAVAEKANKTQKETKELLEIMQEVVFDTMKAEDEVKIFEGVTLSGKMVEERTARNPQDGSEIVVPQHLAPKCKFGKAVKDYLKA